jgi:hypothetical protein
MEQESEGKIERRGGDEVHMHERRETSRPGYVVCTTRQ